MKYGYTRTSTKDKQDDDLQRRALIDTGVDPTLLTPTENGANSAN